MILPYAPLGKKYFRNIVRILDSDQTNIDFGDTLQWLREEEIDHYTDYEPMNEPYHDSRNGYWVFRFKNEEDKMKFILRWL